MDEEERGSEWAGSSGIEKKKYDMALNSII